MMYQLVIERNAQKQLAKISTGNYDKIIEALKDLIHNPRPHGYKKLKGRPGYRINVQGRLFQPIALINPQQK